MVMFLSCILNGYVPMSCKCKCVLRLSLDSHLNKWQQLQPLLQFTTPNNINYLRFSVRHEIVSALAGASFGRKTTRDVDPVLFWCWASVADGGPTSNQHRVNVTWLLGINLFGHRGGKFNCPRVSNDWGSNWGHTLIIYIVLPSTLLCMRKYV